MIQQAMEYRLPRHEASDALDRVNFYSVEAALALIHSEAAIYDAELLEQQEQQATQQEAVAAPKVLKLHHMRAEIEQVVSMGFDRGDVDRALVVCRGNVSDAIT